MEVKVIEENNERLDKYLASKLEISRTLISKMIDNEYILVNGKKTKSNYKVRVNDLITIDETYEDSTDIVTEKIYLNIFYEWRS